MPFDYREVEQFIFKEAALADESRYAEWEDLWADDGVYWVPSGDDDYDPTKRTSVIFDNRRRIATRIKQLKSGKRYSQEPPSRMRRVVSNILVENGQPDDEAVASCNFIISEVRVGINHIWCGQSVYKLRRENGSFKMVLKKVMLVDNAEPIPTLAFLI